MLYDRKEEWLEMNLTDFVCDPFRQVDFLPIRCDSSYNAGTPNLDVLTAHYSKNIGWNVK